MAFLCFEAVLGVKRGLPLLKKTQTLELLSPSVKQDNQVSGTHRGGESGEAGICIFIELHKLNEAKL